MHDKSIEILAGVTNTLACGLLRKVRNIGQTSRWASHFLQNPCSRYVSGFLENFHHRINNKTLSLSPCKKEAAKRISREMVVVTAKEVFRVGECAFFFGGRGTGRSNIPQLCRAELAETENVFFGANEGGGGASLYESSFWFSTRRRFASACSC